MADTKNTLLPQMIRVQELRFKIKDNGVKQRELKKQNKIMTYNMNLIIENMNLKDEPRK
jgi:hypothetical protein